MKGIYGLVVTTQVRIFGPSEHCSAFKVGCRTGSANEILVNIPVLHGKEWFPVFPGGEEKFRTEDTNAIDAVNVKSAGTSTIDGGVVERSA